MESAVKENGIAREAGFTKSLLVKYNGVESGTRITVQQALCKWYSLFSQGMTDKNDSTLLFSEIPDKGLLNSLRTDIEMIPSVLMDEFIDSTFIFDKHQYIHLVQALLTNLSDELFSKDGEYISVCNQIENTLQFIQNFFYQFFDTESRLTKYRLREFLNCSNLKLDYLQLRLKGSGILETLKDCLVEKFASQENNISFRQTGYLKYLIKQIESATTIITEVYIRDLFFNNNFNSECFVNYEIELIKSKLDKLKSCSEAIQFLKTELNRISQLKLKPSVSYDLQHPSIKKQLYDWITEEVKQAEFKDRKTNGKDLLIDPESKIQTSLSVAKLAVLIRLLVVDKIIINKSVAPMLRTITKLFTTLQKDEISFGSLETKYHAPDKATLNTMKEMLVKWVNILGKL